MVRSWSLAFESNHRFSILRTMPIAASLLAVLAVPAARSSATRHVPSEYPTIKAAVIAAETGDSILIAPGTYTGADNRGIDVGLKQIYIRGTGAAGTVVIDAEGAANCFSFANSPVAYTTLSGLKLRRGVPYGVYVYNAGARLTDCILEECASALLLAGSNMTMRGLTITGCTSSAVKVSTSSACEIRDSSIESNTGAYGGGIQIIHATLTLTNCEIQGNDASSDGGGIYCESGGVTLSDVLVAGNRCTGMGGGIRLLDSSSTLEYATVSRNLAASAAGGVSCTGSSAVFDHSVLWGNCAPPAGREIQVDAGSSTSFGCSVVDASGVGGPGGITYDPSAILFDPLFCAMGICSDPPTAVGDFHVALGSPCVGGSCGYVGHFVVGCAETRIQATTWGAIRAAFR